MTEAQWLASEDPRAMLESLRREWDKGGEYCTVSDRKLRLFACACAHVASDGYTVSDKLARRADWSRWVESPRLGELTAIEAAIYWTGDFLGLTRGQSATVLRDVVGNPYKSVTLPRGAKRKCAECGGTGELTTSHRFDCYDCDGKGFIEDTCPWLTPQVMDLAAATYEHRIDGALDPFRLALLADALEEAGCDNGTILDHLRGQWQMPDPNLDGVWLTMADNKPHWRGCWAVDLILGKE